MHLPEIIQTIIIEDCRFSNIILQHFCESHTNIQLNRSFEDLSEAIPHIETHPVDLVFLDIELKHSNGFDVLKYLKPQTIVILTSYKAENFEIAKKNGINHYLPKPFAIENFLSTIERIKRESNSD